MIEFPKDFLWGAATAAHQVEGNNINNDWWEWEQRVGLKEPSGQACRHYEFYKQDFDLAQVLGHNAHRLSVEWSRIEPEEGKFSERELKHYRDVVISLKERGIQPIVTLHHFTNPLWFAGLGGWLNKASERYFLRYVEKITEALADSVRFWVTINEPMVYVYHSYLLGVWPPQEKSYSKTRCVTNHLASAHIKTYRLIHRIYEERRLNSPSVGMANNLQLFEPYEANLRNRLAVYLRDRSFNFALLDKLIRHKTFDFIGVNYYTRSLVEAKGWKVSNLLLDVHKNNHNRARQNSLGWDIYPLGLYKLLLRLKRYKLPVFILENGICTEDDNLRWEFIAQHLTNLNLAMQNGVRVLGYIYWSLIDNFEWDKGFGPRFGLIEMDYNTYKRTIRESARKLSEVCKTGIL